MDDKSILLEIKEILLNSKAEESLLKKLEDIDSKIEETRVIKDLLLFLLLELRESIKYSSNTLSVKNTAEETLILIDKLLQLTPDTYFPEDKIEEIKNLIGEK